MIRLCKICGKEFTPAKNNHMIRLCGKECKIVNRYKTKRKYYEEKVQPLLPGPRPLKTEEEKKQTEWNYNNKPERKAYMKEYRKPEERRIKERASGKKWAERNPEVQKNGHLRRHFGISIQDYKQMLEEQNNVCAICKKPEAKIFKKTGKVCDLAVDHCHATGKVRGLLCWQCNSSIGKFQDSIETLQNAIDYLKKYKD